MLSEIPYPVFRISRIIYYVVREGYGFTLTNERDWLEGWSRFCYSLISVVQKGATMSKFLYYEDRLIIAQCLQENAFFGEIGKEKNENVIEQQLQRRQKSTLM